MKHLFGIGMPGPFGCHVVCRMRGAPRADTPFQEWCETLLDSRRWTLRGLARRLGVSPSPPYQYRAGNMLPTAARQYRLAELTGTPVEEIARLVWESKAGRRADLTAQAHIDDPRPGPSPGRPGMRWWGWRGRPLGVRFTMYPTRGIDGTRLERLYALATARRVSLEAMLDEALRLALPVMERRGRRP